MNARIFWIVVVGTLVGVFVRTLVPFGWVTISFFIGTGLVGLCFFIFKREIVTLLFSIAVISFALGAARMHTGIIESNPILDAVIGERVVLVGVVHGEPDVRENNVRISLTVTHVASTTIEHAGVLVVAPLHTEVAYGDRVRIEGELNIPQRFETGKINAAEDGSPDPRSGFRGRFFEYPGFLAKDGILYSVSFAKVTRLEERSGNRLKVWSILLKQKYLDGIELSLPEPQAGLAGGITVGDKRGLGEELSETFRTVGLTHIVVLSGYNIMVVVEALLRWMVGTPQTVRLSIAGCVAFFFAAITGFASASTRAAAMAMIAIVGKATGRTYLASRALGLVALLMVLWNPYILVFDPGFQLSILATMGIIFITPLLEEYLGFVTARFGFRDIAAATLGTQVAVVPLLLYQNGQLSMFALPANLLTLIAVPLAMLLSVIAALAGLITGALAPIFGLPAYAFLSYIIYVAKVFASLPFASLSIPSFNPLIVFFVYVSMAVVLVYIYKAAGSGSRRKVH